MSAFSIHLPQPHVQCIPTGPRSRACKPLEDGQVPFKQSRSGVLYAHPKPQTLKTWVAYLTPLNPPLDGFKSPIAWDYSNTVPEAPAPFWTKQHLYAHAALLSTGARATSLMPCLHPRKPCIRYLKAPSLSPSSFAQSLPLEPYITELISMSVLKNPGVLKLGSSTDIVN